AATGRSVNDLLDLCVCDVAGRLGAPPRFRPGLEPAAGKLAFWTPAARLLHLERAPVAGHADHDLLSGNAGLGDHGQRLLGLGQVDLAAEAVTRVAALLSPRVVRVPL